MKKFLGIVLAMAMVLTLLAGCGARGGASTAGGSTAGGSTTSGDSGSGSSTSEPSGETYVLRLGDTLAEDHPYNVGARHFSDLVAEKTNGAVKIDVFGNSQLGAERDLLEGLQLGTVEMCVVSTAPLSGYTASFYAFDLPYIFTSSEHARGFLDSDQGMEILQSLSSQGIKGLAYWENGFRHITNSKLAITKPSDLKGLKIRTMENEVMMYSFSCVGADPTPMAFNELYTALQQKTMDGQENPYAIISTSKFYETQPYCTASGHFYAAAPLLMSQTAWDSLPAEYQEIIQECAFEARDYERQLLEDINTCRESELAGLGMQITQIGVAEWAPAFQPVYDKYVGDGKLIDGGLVEAIQNFQP